MIATRLHQAAYNNAVWCDTVCRAHGSRGEFHPSIWVHPRPVPRFYPNAVTLTAGGDAAAQLAHLGALVAAQPAAAIKDSFAALDLAPLRRQPLFDATWLWRDGARPLPVGPEGVQWNVVHDADRLAAWEHAWSGAPWGAPQALSARIFLPALLAAPDVAFIAATRAGQIVAGAIVNRAGDVAGLSNVFTPRGEAAAYRAGCIVAAAEVFPGLALVGYERGDDLARALELGFEPIGPLRVWGAH